MCLPNCPYHSLNLLGHPDKNQVQFLITDSTPEKAQEFWEPLYKSARAFHKMEPHTRNASSTAFPWTAEKTGSVQEWCEKGRSNDLYYQPVPEIILYNDNHVSMLQYDLLWPFYKFHKVDKNFIITALQSCALAMLKTGVQLFSFWYSQNTK